MKALVLSASPNEDGLTAACAQAAKEGLLAGGLNVEQVNLNKLNIGSCAACDRGWGTCRTEQRCQVEDDFQALHERTYQTDALVIVTPVYWWEMSESAKAFTDRVRRCEAIHKTESRLLDIPMIMVAAAGGSGNGTISCLASMERWIQHVRGDRFDMISVNRWTRDYKILTIEAAGKALAIQLLAKTTKPEK
jgi:multimeric flavodoxin WrbA